MKEREHYRLYLRLSLVRGISIEFPSALFRDQMTRAVHTLSRRNFVINKISRIIKHRSYTIHHSAECHVLPLSR